MAAERAVVLLSGGLDSMVTAAMARAAGYRLNALTIDYNQRHHCEIDAARRIAALLGAARHVVLPLDLRQFGGSALTTDVPVPKDRSDETMGESIPVTYVPARNTVFLAYALAWADVLGAFDIFVGVNALDYSGYPDCRPEFVAAFEAMANLAIRSTVETGRRLTIHAPLIHMTKAEIVRRGLELGVDYAMTTSCYDPSPEGRACGHCDACILRRKGFAENGLEDPALGTPLDGGRSDA